MRLSEAIRLGAMLGPQTTGQMYVDGATCALGAAACAVGMKSRAVEDDYGAVMDRWPWLRDEIPTGYLRIGSEVIVLRGLDDYCDAIYQLNDDHKWTREQIADWVEMIEPKDDPAPSHGEARTSDAVDPTVRHTEVGTTRA